jgi:hypothetical protein
MHDMVYIHDTIVRDLRNAGVPDWLANIPTMGMAYGGDYNKQYFWFRIYFRL